MFAGSDAPWHWLILGILVIALFGYKKLPDAARAMGRSLRIFKTEIKGMTEDDAAREALKTEAPTASQPAIDAAAHLADAPPPVTTEPAEQPDPAPLPPIVSDPVRLHR